MVRIRPSETGDAGIAGFTLTELLVVLATAGLLVTAAPILLQSVTPGVRSAAAARALAEDLRATRAAAIASGIPAEVVFQQERQRYVTGPGGRIHALPNGIDFTLQTGRDRSAIEFFPDGSSSGGAILVGDKAWRHRVSADWLTGRVTIDE